MPELTALTFEYRNDEGVKVTYTREITTDQLAELIQKLDEMADDNEG